jgi:hypothetical protein
MTSFSQYIVDESDKERNIKTEILRKLQRKEKNEAERKKERKKGKNQGNCKKYLDRLV